MKRSAAVAAVITLLGSGASLALQARQPIPQGFSSGNEDWKAPELRISVDEFKRLEAKREVLVVDVRDPQSYRQGHLPGAILMTPEALATDAGREKLKGERRTIVTYCS